MRTKKDREIEATRDFRLIARRMVNNSIFELVGGGAIASTLVWTLLFVVIHSHPIPFLVVIVSSVILALIAFGARIAT